MLIDVAVFIRSPEGEAIRRDIERATGLESAWAIMSRADHVTEAYIDAFIRWRQTDDLTGG
jgi:hypothetical protein